MFITRERERQKGRAGGFCRVGLYRKIIDLLVVYCFVLYGLDYTYSTTHSVYTL